MIYIKKSGIYNNIPEKYQSDPREELLGLSGKSYRRIDRFINLSILGAHKAVGDSLLDPETGIYMCSGLGNINVFEKVRDQRMIEKRLPRPVDFINMVSNAAGFYVATHLGLMGKNVFLAHHHFPVQMAMFAIQTQFHYGKINDFLLGCVDECIDNHALARKLYGLPEDAVLGEGSNWMLIQHSDAKAQAKLELGFMVKGFDAIRQQLEANKSMQYISFSPRFHEDQIKRILAINPKWQLFDYESESGYYETMAMFAINRFLEIYTDKNAHLVHSLIHLDIFEDEYMAIYLHPPNL